MVQQSCQYFQCRQMTIVVVVVNPRIPISVFYFLVPSLFHMFEENCPVENNPVLLFCR